MRLLVTPLLKLYCLANLRDRPVLLTCRTVHYLAFRTCLVHSWPPEIQRINPELRAILTDFKWLFGLNSDYHWTVIQSFIVYCNICDELFFINVYVYHISCIFIELMSIKIPAAEIENSCCVHKFLPWYIILHQKLIGTKIQKLFRTLVKYQMKYFIWNINYTNFCCNWWYVYMFSKLFQHEN